MLRLRYLTGFSIRRCATTHSGSGLYDINSDSVFFDLEANKSVNDTNDSDILGVSVFNFHSVLIFYFLDYLCGFSL